MKIEVSIGEIIDKFSILLLKKNKIFDARKLTNIENEFNYLESIITNELKIDEFDITSLIEVNEKLWDIEDQIRKKEKEKNFDFEFIELARLVYITNDERAKIKKQINIKYNSNFKEEKSYVDF